MTKPVDSRSGTVAAAPAAKRPRHSHCTQCGARPNERGIPRIYSTGICGFCRGDDYSATIDLFSTKGR